MLIDVRSIRSDFTDGWSCQKAALGPGVAAAGGLIIGVEKVWKGIVKQLITGLVPREDKRLEKPTGVGQMPFHRACVRH